MQMDCKQCGSTVGQATAVVSLFYFAGGSVLTGLIMPVLTRR